MPVAFVRLEALPLTPNGKLDRKSLPTPECGAFSACAYESPKGEVEQRLAGIWAELLHMKWIGRHDNFFDLGGHSLLAIQMVSMLKKVGIELQVAALFTHPTVERLAAFIEGEEKTALPDGVVAIRSREAGTPLFLVHEVSGEVIYAPPLTHHIDSSIPVYGLVDIPLGAATYHTTMYAKAKQFVRTIRAVQPHGPYRIAGWCLGGIIAYEIATQLIGEDETVEFLGLFNSSKFQERAPLDDDEVLLKHVLQIVNENGDSLKAQLESRVKTADIERFVMSCQKKQLLPPNMSVEDSRHYLVRMMASIHALYNYHPQPIPIPIYLFRAMDEIDDVRPARDDYLGWTELLPKAQIRVIPVPGTHYSMVQPPQIEMLGRSLSAAMRQASLTKQEIPVHNDARLVMIQN